MMMHQRRTTTSFSTLGLAALIVLMLECTQLAEAMPSRLSPRRGTAFSATMPERLKQCEPTTIEFANSGNLRPLTVVVILAENLPDRLRTNKLLRPATTTLERFKGCRSLQTFIVKKRDYDPYTFTALAKRGDKIEVFAFFPNGTGQNMWLPRTISSGSSASCLPCASTEYKDSSTNKCAPCSSLFANSTSCTATAAKTCSYGVVTGGKCVAKRCSTRQWPGPNGDQCIVCPDAVARSCDAQGKSTSCSLGVPTDGVCLCPTATYPSPNGAYHRTSSRSCLPCPLNATACNSNGRATNCTYGMITDAGKCQAVTCPNQGIVNTKGDESCADKAAASCSSANISTSCGYAFKLGDHNTTSNSTFCTGPFSSRYGNGKYKYGMTTTGFVLTSTASSAAACAADAYTAGLVVPYVWFWSDEGVMLNGTYSQCRAVPYHDSKTSNVTSYTGYDIGVSGTCAESSVNWPLADTSVGECQDYNLASQFNLPG
ncbi:BQ2448_2994 [Microbotryum intermedium]|uniref:BQ2448_2994 protein n=1 Tax=Microbotryum intermedium TaxID=269621 RepID=A0A238FJZ8_9BASI|nr:BQ2448_2994 [Microbotryum intermedium]